MHLLFQLLLNVTLQSLNIQSIVICANAMDSLFALAFSRTVALEFYPHPAFHVTKDVVSLYDGSGFYLSLGYIVIAMMTLPLGFFNLDDNMKVQWLSFFGLLALMGEFMADYTFVEGLDYEHTKLFGTDPSQLTAVFITAWGYALLIPSWTNELVPAVYPHINAVIWGSAIVTQVGYIAFSVLAMWSYPEMDNDDLPNDMGSNKPILITHICISLFSLFIILPGIPVYCITTRYNLYVGGICGKYLSYFLGVVAPWAIGFLFAQGPLFAALLNYSALFFSGFVNYTIPFMLYWRAHALERRRHRDLLTAKASLPYDRFSALPGALDRFYWIIAPILILLTLCSSLSVWAEIS